jgi:hypothetical protein
VKASLYRGQRVLLFAGHAPAGHALVCRALVNQYLGNDRIVFSRHAVPCDAIDDADYRFANGQESSRPVPPIVSPDASRPSIGAVSSSGSIVFADRSGFARSRSGMDNVYGYGGRD